MIVAVGSLQREAAGIIRSGQYSEIETPEDFVVYQPEIEGIPAIVLSGSGAERAARATQWAIDEFSPEAIISFGFCGATKEHGRSGDIVIAAHVIDLPGTPFEWSTDETDESLGPDGTLLLAARTAVEVAGLDYHHGIVVTVSRIATTSGMKRWLGQALNATAVDTESYAVAATANAAGISWISTLSVLDEWDFDLPKIVDRVGSGPRERGRAAYIKYLSSSPHQLPNLMRLGRSSTRASFALTTFITAFMEAHSALTGVSRASVTS
jgi:nucleoside phosphorylase